MPSGAPQIGVDPATGRITLNGMVLDQYDPRLWGRSGRNITDIMSSGDPNGMDFDGRYYYQGGRRQVGSGDASYEVPDWAMRPEYASDLDGWVQLAQSGTGGWSEVTDPSQLRWSDEFGLLTQPGNMRGPDPAGQRNADIVMALAGMAGLGAVASHAGWFGSTPGAQGDAAMIDIPGDLPIGNTPGTGTNIPLDGMPDIGMPNGPPPAGAPTSGSPGMPDAGTGFDMGNGMPDGSPVPGVETGNPGAGVPTNGADGGLGLNAGNLNSIARLGMGAYNLLNGGKGPGSNNGMPGANGTDETYRNVLNAGANAYGDQLSLILPYLQQAFGNGATDFAALAPLMRGYAGQMGTAGQGMIDSGGELRRAGMDTWLAAQDPRQEQYNYGLGQTRDASRLGTSIRGIGMSPQAAGLEGQAVGDYNRGWRDEQYRRMVQGLQGMSGAYDASGRQIMGGSGLLGNSAQMYTGAAGLPFQLAGLYGNAMQSNVYGPMAGLTGAAGGYMGLGMAGQNQNFNQGQTNLNNWTTAFDQFSRYAPAAWGQMSNWFGNSGASSGSDAASWVNDTGWG